MQYSRYNFETLGLIVLKDFMLSSAVGSISQKKKQKNGGLKMGLKYVNGIISFVHISFGA